MLIKHGTTRSTILIWKLAFKIPILHRSLKHFAKGWLANIDERTIWKEKRHIKLCPVYFSLFGFINIMPRARPVIVHIFDKQWCLQFFSETGADIDVCSGWKNFGYIKCILHPVLIDYATCRESNEFCSDCDDNCVLKS